MSWLKRNQSLLRRESQTLRLRKLGLHQGKEQRSFFLIAAEKEQADQSLNVVQPSVLLIPRRNYFFQSLRPGTASQNHTSCSASRTTLNRRESPGRDTD